PPGCLPGPSPPPSQGLVPLPACWGFWGAPPARTEGAGASEEGGRVQRRRGNCLKRLIYIIEKGEENCGHLIEAHKECMRALGFKI
uniref:COX17 oxidase n=1 Tax=Cyanistes caeruleus TaxID=156563 RepID=A0A8C0UZ79_CYACU